MEELVRENTILERERDDLKAEKGRFCSEKINEVNAKNNELKEQNENLNKKLENTLQVKNKFEISHNNHLIARIGDDNNPICQSCQYSLVGDFLFNQEFESLMPTNSSEPLMTFGMVNLVAGPHNVNNMPLTEQKFNAETCLKKSHRIAPLSRFQLFSNLEITHLKNASNINTFCSSNIKYNHSVRIFFKNRELHRLRFSSGRFSSKICTKPLILFIFT